MITTAVLPQTEGRSMVIFVPHDPALIAGGPIDYPALSPTSRDAWLQVTAAVADGL